MKSINIAIIGIGNCASSLVQGLAHYREGSNDHIGLMHWEMGGYKPSDIRIVAAWDIDARKVGTDVAEAIFAKPNCTAIFCADVPASGVEVAMGNILDGVAEHMQDYAEDRTFVVADLPQPSKEEVVAVLRESGADVLMNYLPVGSQKATEFYAECAIEAGVAFVNNIPVFIASDETWAKKFEDAGVPIVGDDIKAQLGATIVHRVLTDLFHKRGVKLDRTYQLNTGGNTDFLNMSNRKRLASKKVSKTEAVQSVAAERMDDDNIHIGPSDYVAWQNDNKVCFLRMEGQMFGGVPMNLELRLSVEDSPSDRGLGGPIHPASAYFCKHPPIQMTDDLAQLAVEQFIAA
jgi:myo-inositol-1-phosphate synthase